MSPVGRGVPVERAVPMAGSVTLTIRGVPASVALALVLAACQEVEGAGGEYLVSREGSDSRSIGMTNGPVLLLDAARGILERES